MENRFATRARFQVLRFERSAVLRGHRTNIDPTDRRWRLRANQAAGFGLGAFQIMPS
jgi:hypothetical protein